MTAPTRVTVLGAGILGAATAHHLARRGAHVTVIDADTRNARSTTASFACVNGSAKTDPGLSALNDRAVEEYRRITHTLGEAAVRFTGQHFVATDPDSLRIAEQRVNAARSRGYGGEILPVDALREREPHLRLDTPPLAVAWFPSDGWADPEALRAHFLTGLITHHRKATAISPTRSGRLQITFADGDRTETDRVVNATGAGAADIELPVSRPPLHVTPGFVVATDTATDLVTTVVRTRQLGIRPDGSRRALLHSHDIDRLFDHDQTTAERAAETLLNRARRMFPDAGHITPRRITRGSRPTPADGKPAIGESANLPGYYELSAHSGITLAPLLGRLLATEILTESRDPILSPFRPDRH
ncbi:NAD(P)/FAD-dependent oxidoreductase [Nonomuraea angiospora]|uniref:Glycine/D-amino acid oxidase-like deaminating enzyme n=1 Tax=Nonomuraea angiospora TaxID=46172 RepID=A0ABR9MHJ9_9ACTN|nr:FAD-dependent oxidoreductase [Nonomuraea angiospora]MBE1592385.1 glycine/D-amino acid oxidase-like deaminating enzyme [Nonomuraea angiospora]